MTNAIQNAHACMGLTLSSSERTKLVQPPESSVAGVLGRDGGSWCRHFKWDFSVDLFFLSSKMVMDFFFFNQIQMENERILHGIAAAQLVNVIAMTVGVYGSCIEHCRIQMGW